MVGWLWHWHYIPKVIFYKYYCCLHMSLSPCYCASSFGHSSLIAHSEPYTFTVPCIHSVSSSHCTAIVDLIGIKGMFLWVSILSFSWGCLFMSTVRLLLLLLYSMGGLLRLDIRTLAGLLNKSVAKPGNLGLIGTDLFCSNNTYIC